MTEKHNIYSIQYSGCRLAHCNTILSGDIPIRVIVKPGKTDQFIHTYTYDLDNRLSAVSTKAGTSGTTEQQARYAYYAHGPLKRTELGGNVQGIDYVYTLQGWLKSINNPSLNTDDPGKDSYTGPNSGFYPDVFAMSLDYYEGDYVRTNSNIESKPASNRYDGNIVMERWQNKYFPAATGTHTAYKYTYDERNFLYNAIYGSYTYTSDLFTEHTYGGYRVEGLTSNSGIQYDANGNITSLLRMNSGYTSIDELTYHYLQGTNKLEYVSDPRGKAGEDIGNQGAGNYTYNSIGQMTGNVADNQKLTYDAYGKVTEIHKTDNSLLAKYFYDDRGFRIKKEVYTTGNTQTTWYVRDVNGNMLTSYYKDGSNNTKLLETPVYGSSRIGLAQYNPDRTLGKYVYELTDHLGNVRAVVSEDGSDAGADIDILSATDYYPGGMRLPNRWYISENYRFGYQGQFAEKDPETGYNQFELRLYDNRINRWLVPDPYNQYFSPYLSMGNNWTNVIDPDGGLGTGTVRPIDWIKAALSWINPFSKAHFHSGSVSYGIKKTRNLYGANHARKGFVKVKIPPRIDLISGVIDNSIDNSLELENIASNTFENSNIDRVVGNNQNRIPPMQDNHVFALYEGWGANALTNPNSWLTRINELYNQANLMGTVFQVNIGFLNNSNDRNIRFLMNMLRNNNQVVKNIRNDGILVNFGVDPNIGYDGVSIEIKYLPD